MTRRAASAVAPLRFEELASEIHETIRRKRGGESTRIEARKVVGQASGRPGLAIGSDAGGGCDAGDKNQRCERKPRRDLHAPFFRADRPATAIGAFASKPFRRMKMTQSYAGAVIHCTAKRCSCRRSPSALLTSTRQS